MNHTTALQIALAKKADGTPQVEALMPKLTDPEKVKLLLDNASKTPLKGVPFPISTAIPAFLKLVKSNPKPYIEQVQKANPTKLQEWINKQSPDLFKGVRRAPATGLQVV